jgi:condensin complex subunit 1
VKKLIEGLSFYRDKLHEEGVYARFQEILAKVRPVPTVTCPPFLLFSFLFCSVLSSRLSSKKLK